MDIFILFIYKSIIILRIYFKKLTFKKEYFIFFTASSFFLLGPFDGLLNYVMRSRISLSISLLYNLGIIEKQMVEQRQPVVSSVSGGTLGVFEERPFKLS